MPASETLDNYCTASTGITIDSVYQKLTIDLTSVGIDEPDHKTRRTLSTPTDAEY